jgi:putative transposase
MDLHTRRILGWATAEHLRTELERGAPAGRFARSADDLGDAIAHNDRGCQYTSSGYPASWRSCACQSMSRTTL